MNSFFFKFEGRSLPIYLSYAVLVIYISLVLPFTIVLIYIVLNGIIEVKKKPRQITNKHLIVIVKQRHAQYYKTY